MTSRWDHMGNSVRGLGPEGDPVAVAKALGATARETRVLDVRGGVLEGRPITAADVAVAAPEAESELAVGFFGSRYERATPGERDYLMAMADVALAQSGGGGDEDSVPSADVAASLGKKPQSLSPARDSLLKKGLVYSGERGRIAFTVPHFGRYLRERG